MGPRGQPARSAYQVRLPPFWTWDSRSWFKMAESTFNRSGVASSLVLPAVADPYRALKV